MEATQKQLLFDGPVQLEPVKAEDPVNNKLCHSIYQQDVKALMGKTGEVPLIITGLEPNPFPGVDLGLLPAMGDNGTPKSTPIRLYAELNLWPSSATVDTTIKVYRNVDDWNTEMRLSRYLWRTPRLQPPHAFWSSQYVDDAKSTVYYSKCNNCAQQNLWKLCSKARDLPEEYRQRLYEAIWTELALVFQDLSDLYIILPLIDICNIWTPYEIPTAQETAIKLSPVVWNFVGGIYTEDENKVAESNQEAYRRVIEQAKKILGLPL